MTRASIEVAKAVKDNKPMSNGDLAKAVGVDRSYVGRILRGEKVPSLEVAGRLARALGLTLDELIKKISSKQAA